MVLACIGMFSGHQSAAISACAWTTPRAGPARISAERIGVPSCRLHSREVAADCARQVPEQDRVTSTALRRARRTRYRCTTLQACAGTLHARPAMHGPCVGTHVALHAFIPAARRTRARRLVVGVLRLY